MDDTSPTQDPEPSQPPPCCAELPEPTADGEPEPAAVDEPSGATEWTTAPEPEPETSDQVREPAAVEIAGATESPTHAATAGADAPGQPVSILRDTGAAQSFILAGALPFSPETYSDLVTGPARIRVRTELLVEGVSVILGNDLAGGKVFPCPIVVDKSVVTGHQMLLLIFLLCSTLVLLLEHSPQTATSLKVGKEDLAAAQKTDPSLSFCLDAAVSLEKAAGGPVTYYWDDGVLMRRWRPPVNGDVLAVHQLVLPSAYHTQILKLVHEHPLSGHLGITKTYKGED
ncbi:hypothetical protein QQF64_017343 [Cirrhinus molitorella]|uniref:Uncharacterized protein n=1 Tax=Cirrhinus molitorella TaxID=172907 RepID=A0ABR3LIG7_9TELE